MKTLKLIITVSFFISTCLITKGQTKEAELEYLSKSYQNKEFTIDEYREKAKKWKEVIENFGGYPELPYNKDLERIEFEYIFELPGIDKKMIYSRIMEWAAINFGSLSAVLHYENYENGKIILKGFSEIPYLAEEYVSWWSKGQKIRQTKCKGTYDITFKDEKIRIKIINVSYESTGGGYGVTGYYVPVYTIEKSVHSLYPITAGELIEWTGKLSLLKETSNEFEKSGLSLYIYILDFKNDYEF